MNSPVQEPITEWPYTITIAISAEQHRKLVATAGVMASGNTLHIRDAGALQVVTAFLVSVDDNPIVVNPIGAHPMGLGLAARVRHPDRWNGHSLARIANHGDMCGLHCRQCDLSGCEARNGH